MNKLAMSGLQFTVLIKMLKLFIGMNSFVHIGTTAYNNKKKQLKMPDQACANSLKLDQIPQDLEMLLTIER